ncbi:MAG: hypothetical protein ACYSUF_05205 [Planctomycetota bacterium]|jgi:hypothetical protein
MNRIGWSRILFGLAALYDAVLGIAFLAAPKWIYATGGVPEPNHWGYIQFPAALLLIFAVMFVAIARDPEGNRGLILYGIGLKVAYCAVAFGHWFGSGIPGMWKPFALVDVVMLALFVWAYAALGASARQPLEASPGG